MLTTHGSMPHGWQQLKSKGSIMLSYIFVERLPTGGHAMKVVVKGVHVFSFIPRLCGYKAPSYKEAMQYIRTGK